MSTILEMIMLIIIATIPSFFLGLMILGVIYCVLDYFNWKWWHENES